MFSIPSIAPQQPGGDFLAALNANRAAQNQQLQNKLLELQAHYYPYETQANIASKSAYAQFVAPQAAAKLISNPNVMNSLTPDQQQALIRSASGLTQNAVGGQFASNLPPPPQSLGEKLIGALLPRIGFGGGQQNPINYIPQPAQNTNIFKQPQMGRPSSEPETNIPPEADEPGYGQTAYGRRVIQQANAPSIPGGKPQYKPNPVLETQAQGAGQEEAAKSEAKIYANEWKDKTKEIGASANAAKKVQDLLKSFNVNYPKLGRLERGPIAGELLGVSEAAQKVDKVTKQLGIAFAHAEQTGHFTNMDLLSAERAIPRRALQPGAAKSISNQVEALQRRIREQIPFYNLAKENGMTVGQADQAWNQYIDQYPLFNHETDELIPRSGNEYKDFLSSQSQSQQQPVENSILERKIVNGVSFARDQNGWFQE